MKIEATPTAEAPPGTLAELGAGIRQRRKQLRVSATAAAEAAGLSRVTLHRIERGEASVAMGLYQRATAAVGLKLQLANELCAPLNRANAPAAQLHLADLPELRRIAWHLDPATELTPKQALDLYERNWRHLDSAAMTPHERAVLDSLVHGVGGGRLLV